MVLGLQLSTSSDLAHRSPAMSIQYSSKESNPSGTKASGFTLAPDPKQQPALWTPSDRLGPNGRRDRLVETIQLSPEDLRDLMLFIYENETYGGVHCTEKVFYKHVPRTFETAIVNQASARYVLNHAIGRNFRRHIPGRDFNIPAKLAIHH